MLVIRQSQLTSLGAASLVLYEDEMISHFVRTYPRECRQAGGEQQIRKLVSAGVERAGRLGFGGKSEVSMYIALQFILGAGFDRDPQLPWAQRTLEDRQIRSGELRLRNTFGEAIEYLEATAGKQCRFIVRALVRVRDWDIATAPKVDGSWKHNMLGLLRTLYPQKFDYQGEEANGLLLDDCLGKCHFFINIQSPQGTALMAILMFIMGSGIDRDLLHPWVARILSDRSFASEKERVEALHSTARKHVADSLANDLPSPESGEAND